MVFPYSFYCSFKETQKTCVWFYNLYALNFLSFSELWFFILFLLPPPPHLPNTAWHAFTSQVNHISILFQEFQYPSARLWRPMGWLPALDFNDCCETSTIIQAWIRRAARFQHVCAPHWHCLPGTHPIRSDTCC